MVQVDVQKCRACGEAYPIDTQICPRCHVPRKGDANKPALAAYAFFLFVMLVMGIGTLIYLGRR